MRRHVLALLAPLVLSSACAPTDEATQEDGPPPPGRLVIVGGALQAGNADVYDAVVRGREGPGPLCVIPTASGDPEGSMAGAVERLGTYVGDAAAVGIPISTEHPELARDSAVVARMHTCSGFYFTGGSQSRIVDVFLPQGDTTPAYRALWDRWQQGAVVAGSSAGAAMMSRVMISGGGSDEAVAHGVASREGEDGVRIRSGMGFFPQAMLDQHFLARGRIGRLLVAALATDSLPLGIGIDENTALVVDGDMAVVVGASAVVLVDAREAQGDGVRRGSGLVVTLAGAGDAVDLSSFQVRRAASKQLVPAGATGPAAPPDILARWAFLGALVDLASSEQAGASFPLEEATLEVHKGDGFAAWGSSAEGGVQGAPAGFGAGPFVVALVSEGG